MSAHILIDYLQKTAQVSEAELAAVQAEAIKQRHEVQSVTASSFFIDEFPDLAQQAHAKNKAGTGKPLHLRIQDAYLTKELMPGRLPGGRTTDAVNPALRCPPAVPFSLL